MPLYMDVHRNLDSATPEGLAQAHLRDVEVQDKYGVHYHKYWFNEETGAVFCLVEGPDEETCARVHREAHGLVADELIEVEPRLVEAFMGTGITNPAGAAVLDGGRLDPAFRVLVFTEIANYTQVAERVGDEAAVQLIEQHHRMVRQALPLHHGTEVRMTGEGLMTSFTSAAHALRFAEAVQSDCSASESVGGHKPQLRIGIAAGEPVAAHQDLFGLSVAAARRICDEAMAGEVLVTAAVRELAAGKGFGFTQHSTVALKGFADPVTIFSLQLATAAVAELVEVPVSGAAGFILRVRDFWAELKRRHVVTVGAVYAGVLFVMLQVAELTFHALNVPLWAYQVLLLIGLFGFPLALVLAWMFDLKEMPQRERQR